MQIKAIKRGQTLETWGNLDIPDGQVVSIEILEPRISQEKGKFGDSLEDFRSKYNIAELDLDIEAIFTDVRNKSLGREVVL
ncbi:MAG: hypothetical protein F6K47_12135 [Symploca sp. SIO2E6]|nr:hypothetical protein [Symploca sp. SIO2E6]